jgi:hypothetical protein
MRITRSLVPGAVLVGLVLLLAACQAGAGPSSPDQPSASPAPTEQPSVVPTEPTSSPTPPQVLEHEVPMLGRSTADGVDVHTLPSADAPLISGERYADGSTVPDIRLATEQEVVVSMGPLVLGEESWYEIRATDGGETYWEGGWVTGESLERAGDAPGFPPLFLSVHGVGSGTSANLEVAGGTPITVRFAAAPLPDSHGCDIDVTLIGTDGVGVEIATEHLTEPKVGQMAGSMEEPSSLFQEEAGEVTLEVQTDCSFAAMVLAP